jgi:ferredoxin
MDRLSVTLIYFSPTRTTRTILETIGQGMAAARIDHLDLTPPSIRTETSDTAGRGAALIGVPVYGGRIPLAARERLQRLKGQDTPAVLVVVYGNRAYEDALLELRDLALEQGFRPVAAGAFIGEHSFSSSATPIAPGRPDPEDLTRARMFGAEARKKLRTLPPVDGLARLHVPGNLPYKEPRVATQIAPVRDKARCVMCGACAKVCPMGAITMGESVATDAGKCIVCCACVKQCPQGARAVTDERIRQIAERLFLSCQARQEPETYL